MTVRQATGADAGPVAAIWNHPIRDTAVSFNVQEKTPAEVAALIAGRPAFFVAQDRDRIVGFATYDQFRGGIGYARTREHTVQLAPGASGRGLGRALMTAIEDHARAAARIRCLRASARKTWQAAPFTPGWAMRRRRSCRRSAGNSGAGWTWCGCRNS